MKERIRICHPQDCVTLLRRYTRMKQEHLVLFSLIHNEKSFRLNAFSWGRIISALRILRSFFGKRVS